MMTFNSTHLQLIILGLALLPSNIQFSFASRLFLDENKLTKEHLVTELPSFAPLFPNPNFVPNPLSPTLPPIPSFPQPITPAFSLPGFPPLPKLPPLPSLPFMPITPSTMPLLPSNPSGSSSLGLTRPIPHGENANP
ncbi:hypothetical protein GLYMA_09G083050v4 [Glycine max]|nr:hypothetical protein GLYMA_09G083050v4 [Glycine max]